jgi:hypothetical protein
MGKRIILAIACLLVMTSCLVSGSCETSETVNFVTYTNEAKGFSIDYPESWEIEPFPEAPKSMVSISTKTWNLKTVRIMVYKSEAPGLSLEEFSELQMQSVSDTAKDYALIFTEAFKVRDIAAIKHTYNCTIASTVYFSLKVYLVQDGTGWILCFDVPQESRDAYESIFESSLNSFRLLE